MNKDSKTHKIDWLPLIGIAIVILGLICLISSCSGGSSNNKDYETCQICHKRFTNKDDVKSIIWSNMCEKCHSNYEYTQELKESLKKYQENYGY